VVDPVGQRANYAPASDNALLTLLSRISSVKAFWNSKAFVGNIPGSFASNPGRPKVNSGVPDSALTLRSKGNPVGPSFGASRPVQTLNSMGWGVKMIRFNTGLNVNLSRLSVYLLIGLLAIVMSATLRAQTAGTGNITGVVEDQSSAAMPGVKVTVTNVDTAIARSTVTDEKGYYAVTSLYPGNYEIQAEAAGFQTLVRKGLTLNVGSDISVPLTLTVGQVTQVTEVQAEAPMVETTSSSVGELVDDNTVRDLPLNGRSYDSLISLESSAPTYRAQGAGSDSAGYTTAFTISGAWQTMNVFIMDGLEVVGGALMSTAPSSAVGKDTGVDAIQEFQLLTGSYSAAYGKRAGAVVNTATRTGTNVFHGSVYEFLRNSHLDDRNFFEGAAGFAHTAPFKWNNFGAALGGPIRKDSTFFFAKGCASDNTRSSPAFFRTPTPTPATCLALWWFLCPLPAQRTACSS